MVRCESTGFESQGRRNLDPIGQFNSLNVHLSCKLTFRNILKSQVAQLNLIWNVQHGPVRCESPGFES